MAENRLPRELTTRDKEKRRWVPASTLPDPTPEPGFGFRWVMTTLLGDAQPTNVSQRMREGYEPVKTEDHPELMLEGNNKGNIEVGGLMLCKMPSDMLEQRSDYYQQQSNNQVQSVSNKFLSQSDPRMPVFAESKSSSSRGSFGNGS